MKWQLTYEYKKISNYIDKNGSMALDDYVWVKDTIITKGKLFVHLKYLQLQVIWTNKVVELG